MRAFISSASNHSLFGSPREISIAVAWPGKRHCFVVPCTTKICDLKDRIAQLEPDLNRNRIVLHYKDKILKDKRSLAGYHIEDDRTLLLTIATEDEVRTPRTPRGFAKPGSKKGAPGPRHNGFSPVVFMPMDPVPAPKQSSEPDSSSNPTTTTTSTHNHTIPSNSSPITNQSDEKSNNDKENNNDNENNNDDENKVGSNRSGHSSNASDSHCSESQSNNKEKDNTDNNNNPAANSNNNNNNGDSESVHQHPGVTCESTYNADNLAREAATDTIKFNIEHNNQTVTVEQNCNDDGWALKLALEHQGLGRAGEMLLVDANHEEFDDEETISGFGVRNGDTLTLSNTK